MSMSLSTKINASRVFFPAAALQVAFAVLFTLAARYGVGGPAAGLIGMGHAHEMLFGFALALIAGYTLGIMPAYKLWPLFGLWLLARFGFMGFPDSDIAQILGPIFALYLALLVYPRFRAAKKWRNKMISPLIVSICSFPLLWLILKLNNWPISHSSVYISSILMLCLLMSFMGGRMIAPAAAGECYKQGYELKARVQPRLEGLLILLLPITALLSLLNTPPVLTGAIVIVVAAVNAVRLYRWQLWRCRARLDIIGLGVGYAWLSLGLFIIGVTLVFGKPTIGAVHIITIGAIGSLSISVMARLHYQKEVRSPPPNSLILFTLSLISVSALTRYASEILWAYSSPLLWVSATTWAVALFWLTSHLLRKPMATHYK